MSQFQFTVSRRAALGLAAGLGASRLAGVVGAQDAPAFSLSLLVEGLDQPLYLVDAADGSGRLFVVEKTGAIRIFQDGALHESLWLDLRDQVSSGGEQGLLGLALHPQFAENGILFVDYTDLDGNTQLVRYTQSEAGGNLVDPSTAFTVLSVDQPAPNHNGGMLAFGPDGYLYVGLGDGGSQGDPDGNGQNLGVLLGKILRIDVDADPGDEGYAVPADNPFVSNPDARSEIWATGLRNPWRFSFDRETGDMWIGDVGQNGFEEIDFQPAGMGGLNYGWSLAEGPVCYNDPACESNDQLTWPVFSYGRDVGIAVTGGYVYRGSAVPGLYGSYLLGDYGTGYLWTLTADGDGAYIASEPAPTDLLISSFGEDSSGELYVVDLNGSVFQIVAS